MLMHGHINKASPGEQEDAFQNEPSDLGLSDPQDTKENWHFIN